jgi:hypothetical protein
MPEAGRESGTYGRFLGQAPVDGALAKLAAAQHGVFHLKQLGELGLTSSAVHKRAASGRLHRVHQAVYSLAPPALLSRDGHWMAAVLACGPGAVLSHRSAAALLGLRPSGGVRIDVTVPGRSCRGHSGIRVHRSTALAPADVTRENNIPCTTVARTALDLTEVVNRRGVERALDQAEILELFDLRALDDQIARNPTRPGASRLHAVLAEHYAGSTPTWSGLEERFLALVRAGRIPPPEVNTWVTLPDGGPAIRADSYGARSG